VDYLRLVIIPLYPIWLCFFDIFTPPKISSSWWQPWMTRQKSGPHDGLPCLMSYMEEVSSRSPSVWVIPRYSSIDGGRASLISIQIYTQHAYKHTNLYTYIFHIYMHTWSYLHIYIHIYICIDTCSQASAHPGIYASILASIIPSIIPSIHPSILRPSIIRPFVHLCVRTIHLCTCVFTSIKLCCFCHMFIKFHDLNLIVAQ
jgi:hypothetical protein